VFPVEILLSGILDGLDEKICVDLARLCFL
jgi:hypothetical protein